MPEMSGRLLVERLTEVGAGFRVLYMSGYSDDVLGDNGVLGQGVELLNKPFTGPQLLERVRRLLDC